MNDFFSKELEEKEGVNVPSTVPDGVANFEYVSRPSAHAKKPVLNPAPPYMHSTPPIDPGK